MYLEMYQKTLTMLNKFHAMNSEKAHTTLPQSESPFSEFVQRGYSTALITIDEHADHSA